MSNSKYSNGAIAFLDILGFKGIWKGITPRELLKVIDDAMESAKNTQQEIADTANNMVSKEVLESEGSIKPPEWAMFSDTIVIYATGNYPFINLSQVGICANHLIGDLLLPADGTGPTNGKSLYLRGAISYGKFFVSKVTFIGEAVDDVTHWYDKSNMIGAIVTPRTYCLMKERLEPKPQYDDFIEYRIPIKSGEMLTYCANWPRYLNRSPDNNPLVQKIYSKFAKEDPFDESVLLKYQNTEKFVNHCLHNPNEGVLLKALLEHNKS